MVTVFYVALRVKPQGSFSWSGPVLTVSGCWITTGPRTATKYFGSSMGGSGGDISWSLTGLKGFTRCSISALGKRLGALGVSFHQGGGAGLTPLDYLLGQS